MIERALWEYPDSNGDSLMAPPTDLNEVAANLYAEIRRSTESPMEGAHACLLCLYVVWRETKHDDDFEGFVKDTASALRELHLLNDVKGEA